MQAEDMKWNSYAQKRWNPFSGDKMDDGKCAIIQRHGAHACWAYCMSLRLAGRCGYDRNRPFQPTFHPDRLDEPLKRKKPTIYATCFMGDIGYCEDEWLIQIMNVIRQCPQHTFLLLTKLPDLPLFRTRSFPDNVYFGATVNLQKEVVRIDHLREVDCKHKWVSFEPPYEHIECDLTGISGIAIGAQTGNFKFMPSYEIVEPLLYQARKDGAEIVIKDNLDTWEPKLREWP